VDQVTEEIVAVTRHCPSSHQSVILMAHTAFRSPESWAVPTLDNAHTHYNQVPPLTIPGEVMEVILEARLMKKAPESPNFERQPGYINGMDSHVLDVRANIPLSSSQFCHLVNESSTQEVQFNEFSPGSIIAFR
jgi:glycogen debranching enzyme